MKDCKYYIRANGKLLSGFHSNDIPISTKAKWNEEQEKFVHNFSSAYVFSTSKNSCLTFDTLEQAKEYIKHMLVECENQRVRWENIQQDITNKTLEFINKKIKIYAIENTRLTSTEYL